MGADVISVDEARQRILQHVARGETRVSHPGEAVGRYLAAAIKSPRPLPLFDNSAMDGYAVRAKDTESASEKDPLKLNLTEIIAAGDSSTNLLGKNQAAQVFTGAMVPAGADSVIRQEDVELKEGAVILRRPVTLGENVRYRGEEIGEGDLLLDAGARLTPAAVGLLISAGASEVSTVVPPRVGLLVTGSEIVNSERDLGAGKIFDSNSHVLASALQQMQIPVVFRRHVVDDRAKLKIAIANGLRDADFLIITGGVSVGKFDYVKEVSGECGMEPVFWRVKQKPGKPLFFGISGTNEKVLFGLPGNPASVLVCFYEYVYPALKKSMGASDARLRSTRVRLQQSFSKRTELTHFLKAKLAVNGSAQILERQGSHMMSSFAAADCLVVVPEETKDLEKGDEVEIHLLPS